MIESIEFANYKALRHTILPLAPFTLLLGPNGSGKTSVLQALEGVANVSRRALGLALQGAMRFAPNPSVSATDRNPEVQIILRLRWAHQIVIAPFRWSASGPIGLPFTLEDGTILSRTQSEQVSLWLGRMQVFVLDSAAIAEPVQVSQAGLQANGSGLAAVLDDLKDNHQERWDSLLAEMRRWLPEYDSILFDKPQPGSKGIALRTKKGGHRIRAHELSQGTLVALALLTLAYLPDPPSVVGLEEIDRGLHPRLLRHLQDALYRLSNPDRRSETRPPIQVIATTHSPYLLDLYREHPEEVVLARKEGLEVEMKRLTDIEHYEEILGDSPLSEVWYSGVLGGVTVKP